MVSNYYAEGMSVMIISKVSTPSGWKPLYDQQRDVDKRTFPEAQPMAGSILLMGWDHKYRDEEVILGFVPEEEDSFGVDVQTNGDTYHAHGARTLESACEAASVCMYMLNHFANETSRNEEEEINYEDQEQYIRDLESKVEQLEEASEAHKQRADEYENKYETIMAQLNTLVDSNLSTYEDGNWHGMIEQPQRWRPPTTDEIIRLKDHIKMHWDAVQKEPQSVPEDRAKRLVSEAFIIVLDDFHSVVTGVEDKMMFALFKSDGSYCTYLFKENDHRLKEVAQNSDIISRDPKGEVVVSFGSRD